jgi:seryl-tRNA synthetase
LSKLADVHLNERISKLEEERNSLQQEKEQLMKRRNELEVELEFRAFKGDFNPMKSKVLHFR